MHLVDIPLEDARCRAAVQDLLPEVAGCDGYWRYVTTPDFTSSVYVVSDRGCVVSLPRYRAYGAGPRRRRFIPGKVLRPGVVASGHRTLTLMQDGTPYKTYLHHVVAWAFLGPQPSQTYVLHRDGDTSNNAAGNLVYSSERTLSELTRPPRTILRLAPDLVQAIREAADGYADPLPVITAIRNQLETDA